MSTYPLTHELTTSCWFFVIFLYFLVFFHSFLLFFSTNTRNILRIYVTLGNLGAAQKKKRKICHYSLVNLTIWSKRLASLYVNWEKTVLGADVRNRPKWAAEKKWINFCVYICISSFDTFRNWKFLCVQVRVE